MNGLLGLDLIRRIHRDRVDAGMSVSELARHLRIPRSGLSEMLNGTRRVPPRLLQRIEANIQKQSKKPHRRVTLP